MKYQILCLCLMGYFNVVCQNNTQIQYDAAGNRISRTTIIDFAGIARTYNTNVNNLQFSVFPNTVTNTLNVKVDKEYANIEKSLYNLYDYNGKLIFSKRVESYDETLDFQSVATGVYLLRLENPIAETVEWKIVKN